MSTQTIPLSYRRKATDANFSPDSHHMLDDHIISDDQVFEFVKPTGNWNSMWRKFYRWSFTKRENKRQKRSSSSLWLNLEISYLFG